MPEPHPTTESLPHDATFYAYLPEDTRVRVRATMWTMATGVTSHVPREPLSPDIVWDMRQISENLTPVATEAAQHLATEILAGRPVTWFSPDGGTICIAPPLHPSIAALLKFFAYAHLPKHLQERSAPFARLADELAFGPQNAEMTVALRKLLEAKDCAVRAWL